MFIIRFLLALCLVLVACDNTPLPEPIPYRIVNLLIDLNNFRYQPLKFDRGYVYEDGGVRGIIIYRQSATRYIAFERNCPHRPLDACALVEVDASGLFMTDRCCQSVFDFEGKPTAGPAFANMLRYRTALSGSLLSITN